MRRYTQSQAWARTRLVTGALFAIFGAVIMVRTFTAVGLVSAAVPAFVLGLAMIALGFVRFREYRMTRRAR
jgi:hypothetical protein